MKIEKEQFNVTGMTCSACSARVEKSVRKLAGIEDVSVNLLTGRMQVRYDQEKIQPDDIVACVINTGYGASTLSPNKVGNHNSIENQDNTKNQHNTKNQNSTEKINRNRNKQLNSNRQRMDEIKEMKHRFFWSLFFLVPMMIISMGEMFFHMAGFNVPTIWKQLFYGNENALTFAFTQFLLVIPIIYLNQHYYKRGLKNLFRGSPNMDTLIAIGSGASFLYGIFAIYRIGYGLGYGHLAVVESYRSDLYFESAGMIVTLITLGKYLETRSKGKTSEAIEKLMNLAPKSATVLRNQVEQEVPIEEIVVEDIIVVRPGERIAADGEIIQGSTSIDESAITGESIPVEKKTGDTAISATINKTGFIQIKVKKVGEDSTINQIIRLVEEASSSKAPIAKMADKISGIFVPVVMAIAVISAIGWLISGAGFEFSLSVGIAVLVISCPCALGLATPVAIMVGTGKGAENGILIKSGEALEIAHNIDTVVMDKTGTITEGKPVITDCIPISVTDQELLKVGISLEQGSEHPLAEAVVQYATEKGITSYENSDFKAVFGRGVQAKIQGKIYRAGNTEFMQENAIDTKKCNEIIGKLSDAGKTPLLFACENTLMGVIAVADVEKQSSKQAIELFKKMGINVVMLTGDNERTAQAIRKKLEIPEVIAQVLPEDKEKHITKLQQNGHVVAMIGDGINDAPALAKADVGIAIGAGTDIAIESADAVLMRNDLMDAVSAIRLSKAVIRNIKQNLFWAFFYNSIGIPLAAGLLYPFFEIKLSPMFGAAAMSLSSVCVVTNALRLKLFKPEHTNENQPNESHSNENQSNESQPNENSVNHNQEEKIMNNKYELTIEGMSCGHCQKRVEEALTKMEGVESAVVNLETKKATVTAAKEISMSEFDQIIKDAGYELVK